MKTSAGISPSTFDGRIVLKSCRTAKEAVQPFLVVTGQVRKYSRFLINSVNMAALDPSDPSRWLAWQMPLHGFNPHQHRRFSYPIDAF
jgi:hypothetical protein